MVKSFPLCAVLLSAFCSLADCPPPDTTKATVVDDLSVLGMKDDIATPDYLFNTIVTNGR